MQQRLPQDTESVDPHLRGAESVHPSDNPNHVVVAVGVKHGASNRIGILKGGLPDDSNRNVAVTVQVRDDFL